MPDAKPLSHLLQAKRFTSAVRKEIVHEDDPRVPMTSAEFLAKAWKVANDKARELGQIV
jgi:hypothetical protein